MGVPTVLAADIGQSGSRLRLVDAAGTSDFTAAGFASGTDPLGQVRRIVTRAVADRAAGRSIDVLSVGMTGLMGVIARPTDLLGELHAALGVRRVVIADDSFTSFVGALGMRAGVVLAAGTGAVTLGWDGGPRHRKVDGWGHLVGDAGSGFWIGRAGLDQALRAFDGRGGSPRLLAELRRRGDVPERLAADLATDPQRVRRIASFTEAVADAARDGDPAAVEILAAAARELSTSVVAAARWVDPTGSVPVALLGNVLKAGPPLLDPLRTALAAQLPAARIERARGSGLDGAAELARVADPDGLPNLVAWAEIDRRNITGTPDLASRQGAADRGRRTDATTGTEQA